MIDLATRMVVGWQLADHLRTSLVTDALNMAITGGHAPAGAVFHSEVASTPRLNSKFHRFCGAHGILPSVGRTGACWANAAAESFFATLKNEMYYRQRFDSKATARFAGAEYIEVFYRRRLHSYLGYRTPAEALADHQAQAAA